MAFASGSSLAVGASGTSRLLLRSEDVLCKYAPVTAVLVSGIMILLPVSSALFWVNRREGGVHDPVTMESINIDANGVEQIT